MNIQLQDIREMDEASRVEIRGGDYVEKGLGLIYGLGLAAGLAAATPLGGPLLVVAGGVGVGFLIYDGVVSGRS
jgi:hypothetical protein